jgi:hypothetical protein
MSPKPDTYPARPLNGGPLDKARPKYRLRIILRDPLSL